jgi:hypothetical protein
VFGVPKLLVTKPDNRGIFIVPFMINVPPEGMVIYEELVVGATNIPSTVVFVIMGIDEKVTEALLLTKRLLIEIVFVKVTLDSFITRMVPKFFVVADDTIIPSYTTSKFGSKMFPNDMAVIAL